MTGCLPAAAVVLWLALWFVPPRSRRWHLGGYVRHAPQPTNATWSQPATRPLTPAGYAHPWYWLSYRRRAAIRDGAELLAWLALYGLVTATVLTLVMLTLAAVTAFTWGCWRAWKRLLGWKHHYTYVRPLQRALPAGTPRPEVAPDRSRVVIALPEEFTGGEKDREEITRAVTAKLAIEAPDANWVTSRVDGLKPQVIFTKSEPPPPRVTSRDILDAVKSAAEHEVIFGIGKKDQVIGASLDTETPHIGFCMTTGDGKSVAAMNASTQILHHGGLVVILDYKLMSHMWARDLPNVAYAGTPPELHEMLCWLAWDDDEHESELTRRKKVALASADIRGNVHADLGPRILVNAEELNVLQKILKKHWRQIGGKGPSPAAEALEEIHFTGRQLRMHAMDIAQRLSTKATSSAGSADSRENIGAIMFSNPSDSTWNMLVDGHAKPPATDHKGRYQLVTRKSVRELQGALWDEEAARAFATSGTVAIPRYDMPLVARVTHVPDEEISATGGPDQPIVSDIPPGVPHFPASVTLEEARAAGVLDGTKDALRKRSWRDPEFPEPVGQRGNAKLYSIDDLYRYKARKVGASR